MTDRKDKAPAHPRAFRIATKGDQGGGAGDGEGGWRALIGYAYRIDQQTRRERWLGREWAALCRGEMGGRVTLSRVGLTAEQRRRSGGWGAAAKRAPGDVAAVTVRGLRRRLSKETARALAAMIRAALQAVRAARDE